MIGPGCTASDRGYTIARLTAEHTLGITLSIHTHEPAGDLFTTPLAGRLDGRARTATVTVITTTTARVGIPVPTVTTEIRCFSCALLLSIVIALSG